MIEQDDHNKPKGNGNYESDNEYGLPEAEFSPVQREQDPVYEERVTSEPVAEKNIQPEQKNSSWPMWIALAVILILAGVFVYFFAFDGSGQDEQITQATPPPAETTTTLIEETPPVEEPAEEDWNNAAPEVNEGSVSIINSRTGHYYMIVGSFVDGDLAQDYANNLAKEGYEAKIIEPSGTRKFYRLSVKDAASIADLNTDLEGMRAKYGENVWIVKY